ncbi:MAG: hypothetical protein QG597_1174 [Actinomycetota bacterium]|nr:hypothetical protein [Actinomycetota bacterium]
MTLTAKPVDLLGGSAGFAVPGFAADRPLWIVADEPADGPLAHDHVMGVGGATRTLLTLTPRLRVGTALDLGSGCGAGALLLTGHAGAVVASDTSARALAATAATMQRNAAAPVMRVRGSLTDPFADHSFDLVVANPPFVITPEVRHDYRDAPVPADSLAPALMAGLQRIPRPGGWAVVLGSWLHVQGADWTDRVAGWFPPGMAAWAAQREVLTPGEYVEFWLRDAGQSDDGPLRRRWLAYLRELSAAAVGMGWLVLHQPTAPTAEAPQWAEDVATAGRVPSGSQVLAEFGRRRSLPDAATILASSPRIAAGVTVDAPAFPAVGVGPSRALMLSAPTGWRAAEPLDKWMSWWFATIESAPVGRTLARALAQCAAATESDPDDVLVSWLTGVRVLMERGFVTLDASPSGCSQ